MANFAVSDIFNAINELAPQFGVPPEQARAIILAENTKDGIAKPGASFSGDATNSNNTMGVGQVIPTTARGLQQAGLLPPDWKFDPNDLKSQLSASLAAMKDMRSRLNNPDDTFELGAYYNGGNRGLKDYRSGAPMVPETAAYLKKIGNSMDQPTPQQIERIASTPAAPAGGGTLGGSSSSTSTTSTSYDPAAMGRFNSANDMFLQSLTRAQDAVDDRQGMQASSAFDLMGSIVQAGQSAGAAAQAKATVEATEAARRQVILQRANLDPSMLDSRMDQALQAIDSTSVALDTLRPAIDARSQVGFFDNPLLWAVAQTRLPGMKAEYNNIVQVQQDAIGKYAAVSGITKDAIDLSKSMDADGILQAGAATAVAERDKAVAQAKQVNYQLQGKSAADALQAVNLNLARLSAAQRELMLTKEKQVETEGLNERDAAIKRDTAALSDYNVLITAAGGNAIPLDRFKQLDAKTKNEILTRNASSGSTSQFGSNLYEATAFVNKFGNLNNMAQGGQLAVTQWVKQAAQAADGLTNDRFIASQGPQAALDPTLKGFDPKKFGPEALNGIGVKMSGEAETNLRAGQGTSYNPFKIPYEQMIKDPKFKDNIWAQDMQKYGPTGSTPLYQNFDEENFLRRAVTAVAASPDPAASIKRYAQDAAQFYQVASKQTQATTKPQMFGLETPSRTYAVVLPSTNVGGKPTITDLGDSTQIERALTTKLIQNIRTSQLQAFGAGDQFPMFGGETTPEQQQFLQQQGRK